VPVFEVSVLPSPYTFIDERIEYLVCDRLLVSLYNNATMLSGRSKLNLVHASVFDSPF